MAQSRRVSCFINERSPTGQGKAVRFSDYGIRQSTQHSKYPAEGVKRARFIVSRPKVETVAWPDQLSSSESPDLWMDGRMDAAQAVSDAIDSDKISRGVGPIQFSAIHQSRDSSFLRDSAA